MVLDQRAVETSVIFDGIETKLSRQAVEKYARRCRFLEYEQSTLPRTAYHRQIIEVPKMSLTNEEGRL